MGNVNHSVQQVGFSTLHNTGPNQTSTAFRRMIDFGAIEMYDNTNRPTTQQHKKEEINKELFDTRRWKHMGALRRD